MLLISLTVKQFGCVVFEGSPLLMVRQCGCVCTPIWSGKPKEHLAILWSDWTNQRDGEGWRKAPPLRFWASRAAWPQLPSSCASFWLRPPAPWPKWPKRPKRPAAEHRKGWSTKAAFLLHGLQLRTRWGLFCSFLHISCSCCCTLMVVYSCGMASVDILPYYFLVALIFA